MPREAAHHGESCSKGSVGFTHGGSCGGYRRGVKRVEIAGRGVVGRGILLAWVAEDMCIVTGGKQSQLQVLVLDFSLDWSLTIISTYDMMIWSIKY